MGLVLAFAELAGAVLLLTAAITGATLAEVVSGEALASYRREEQASTTQATTTQATSSAPLAPAGRGGGVNPFSKASGLVAERTDQGKDFSMNPGSPILAPYASQFLGIEPDWFQGEPYMAFKIIGGPNIGKVYYLAEQIIPESFTAGQQIPAGTQIATYASSGTGIEFGLANPANWRETLAQATGGYTEGEVTQAGQEWTNILASLGVHV